MWQGIVVISAVVGALAYLLWYWRSGHKKSASCPDCVVHEKIAAARKQKAGRISGH